MFPRDQSLLMERFDFARLVDVLETVGATRDCVESSEAQFVSHADDPALARVPGEPFGYQQEAVVQRASDIDVFAFPDEEASRCVSLRRADIHTQSHRGIATRLDQIDTGGSGGLFEQMHGSVLDAPPA